MTENRDGTENEEKKKRAQSLKQLGVDVDTKEERLSSIKAEAVTDLDPSTVEKKIEKAKKKEQVDHLTDRLYKEAEVKKERQSKLAKDQEQKILEKCSFKPQVSKHA